LNEFSQKNSFTTSNSEHIAKGTPVSSLVSVKFDDLTLKKRQNSEKYVEAFQDYSAWFNSLGDGLNLNLI